MKPLPPSQVIAEYRAAFLNFHGYLAPTMDYKDGWFRNRFGAENRPRYRGAQIIHMTATLNERAKAKG